MMDRQLSENQQQRRVFPTFYPFRKVNSGRLYSDSQNTVSWIIEGKVKKSKREITNCDNNPDVWFISKVLFIIRKEPPCNHSESGYSDWKYFSLWDLSEDCGLVMVCWRQRVRLRTRPLSTSQRERRRPQLHDRSEPDSEC